MIRLFVAMMLYVTVARWIYSEIRVEFPKAVPVINYALAKIQIPTHDKWSKTAIDGVIRTVETSIHNLTAPKTEEQDS